MKRIILEDALLGYGKKNVLSEVNLEIVEGDVCLIKGANGSGKTTLGLGILGILHLQSGRRDSTFSRLSYVPQTNRFDAQYPITLEELVAMGLRDYGAICARRRDRRNETRTAILEALSRVGLFEKAKSLFHQVSGGEFQRALIARALISRPEAVLLDEPFANIDRTGKLEIKKLLLDESRRLNCTLIIIDHHENVDFCTNCLEIENGRVIANGAG